MANKLSSEIRSLYQRSGTNAGMLRTEGERAAFAANVKADIANIIYQYNVVVKPLLSTLSSEEGLNALDFGLAGNVLFTHSSATRADAVAFYDEDLARARTVKETVDVLLSELARLENLIDNIEDASAYDDAAIRTLIGTNDLNLEQLALDTMGANYTLDGDGSANIGYSLSQAVDAIGAFFAGFPGTGNTYTTTFPTLAFSVLLSDVVLDTTVPISTITNLTDYLSYIRTFIGMGSVGPETPTYSVHGAVSYVADGDSLEKSIRVLDSALVTLHPVRTIGAILFGDGDSVPAEDAANLTFDNTNNRLGIGTNAPDHPLDVRGIIQHAGGVISRGGNTRGANANDLQVIRGGAAQVASGARSTILGGGNNTATGADSLAMGWTNIASGDASTAFGETTSASAPASFAMGSKAAASRRGELAQASGFFTALGDAQTSSLVVRAQTPDVGPYQLYIDGATGLERITTSDNTSYGVIADIVALDGGGNTNHYVVEATIKRRIGAGTTALVGTTTRRIIVEDMPFADADVVADAINGAIVVQVTGPGAVNVRWVANVRLTSVTF